MSNYRYQRVSLSFGGPTTRAVKMLIIANVAVFLLRYLARGVGGGPFDFDALFGLVPALITRELFLWQFVTYLFVHAGVLHILFNMLALWMFGCDLERQWGFNKFLQYYFLTGVGAGFCSYIINPWAFTATVGASGAIFGLLLAYGVLFADRIIYLYFLFPIKAKYFVMIMGAIVFFMAVTSSASGISNSAHLGGMIFGFLYLKRQGFTLQLRRLWAGWKAQRARRKFQVYRTQSEEKRTDSRHKGENHKPMIQ